MLHSATRGPRPLHSATERALKVLHYATVGRCGTVGSLSCTLFPLLRRPGQRSIAVRPWSYKQEVAVWLANS